MNPASFTLSPIEVLADGTYLAVLHPRRKDDGPPGSGFARAGQPGPRQDATHDPGPDDGLLGAVRRPHHALLARMHVDHIDHLTRMIDGLDERIEQVPARYAAQRRRPRTIPGSVNGPPKS